MPARSGDGDGDRPGRTVAAGDRQVHRFVRGPQRDEQVVPAPQRITAVDPLGYLDFIGLIEGSRLVLTDSGGIQEETSVLGVPCLTMREETERPITVEQGTNILVGTDHEAILGGVSTALSSDAPGSEIPLWDGRAASRIAEVLMADLRS